MNKSTKIQLANQPNDQPTDQPSDWCQTTNQPNEAIKQNPTGQLANRPTDQLTIQLIEANQLTDLMIN